MLDGEGLNPRPELTGPILNQKYTSLTFTFLFVRESDLSLFLSF
jgi:hypothetical protein